VSYRIFFFFIIFVLKCIEYLWANENIIHSPEIIIRPFWASPNTMIPGFFVSTWDHPNPLMDAGCAKTMLILQGPRKWNTCVTWRYSTWIENQ
jgi:hypothetical protein